MTIENMIQPDLFDLCMWKGVTYADERKKQELKFNEITMHKDKDCYKCSGYETTDYCRYYYAYMKNIR